MGIAFQTKSKSKKYVLTEWLLSTDKGLTAKKMKKELLNCTEKYRVLRTLNSPRSYDK